MPSCFRCLRTKLIALFMAIVLIPLVGTSFYGVYFTSEALADHVQQRSNHDVLLHARNTVNSLTHIRDDMLYLSRLRTLGAYLQQQAINGNTADHWRKQVGQDFLVILASRPMYDQIRYLDEAGQEIVRVDWDGRRAIIADDNRLQNKSHRYYVQQGLDLSTGGLYISELDLNREHGMIEIPHRPVLRYILRLDQGLLVINVDARGLLPEFDTTDAAQWGVTDQDGYFLSHPNVDWLWGSPRDLAHGTRLQTVMPEADVMRDGSSGIVQTEREVIAYTTIYPVREDRSQFWTIYRAVPISTAYASVANFTQTALLVIVIAFTIAFVLALIFSKHIVNPIQTLQKQVEDYGRSGTIPDAHSHQQDEIGALMHAFRNMAAELNTRRQQLRVLLDQSITAQEEERKLVAYDLHDGLVPQLVGAQMHLAMCESHCCGSSDSASHSYQRSTTTLETAIAEARRIIEGLRPTALDDLGLVAAIADMAGDAADTDGWKLKLNLSPLADEPEHFVGVTLYRIAQEALNNVRKHADASEVRIDLDVADDLTLTISDDGRGFDPHLLVEQRESVGLTGMQERARMIGATCQIETQLHGGTSVRIKLPYQLMKAGM